MGVKKGDSKAGAFAKKTKRHVGDDPNVRSVITFNKGGQWNFLQPPSSDSLGKPTNCFPNAGCSLHIHGTSDYWGPFYSLDSAIGLAMATGNPAHDLHHMLQKPTRTLLATVGLRGTKRPRARTFTNSATTVALS